MTLKDWLARERRREYSGINARQTLKRLGRTNQTAYGAVFGLAVTMRSPDIKRLQFKCAREIKARGL